MPATSVALCEPLENRRLFAASPHVLPSDAVVADDINNDGNVDLAAPIRNGIGVRLGNGDGTFSAARRIPLPGSPVRVASGDLNTDGVVDLVAGPDANGIIAILIGLKAPTIPAQQQPNFDDPFFFDLNAEVKATTGVALRSRDAKLLVGNFDGLGGDDFGVIDHHGVLVALLLPQFKPVDEGDIFDSPAFEGHVVASSPLGNGVRVATGDVNGDGLADLIGLDQRGHVHLALGSGLGVWDDSDIVHKFVVLNGKASPQLLRVDQVAVGDVNGDGVEDIVALAGGRVRAVTINDDNDQVQIIPLQVDLGPVPRSLQSGIVVADVNNDGIGDLLALIRTQEGILPFIEQGSLF